MLSRNLKRVLLDSRYPLPPTFLLPWAANLTTLTHPIDASTNLPPPSQPQPDTRTTQIKLKKPAPSPALPSEPTSPSVPARTPSEPPLNLSHSLRSLLPALKAQGSHYITLHIHGKPYLVTQGDTIRLPFYMHGVGPGDILRMNRAINIGSRDFTLKPSAAPPRPGGGSRVTLTSPPAAAGAEILQPSVDASGSRAPHFIPHIAQGRHSYLDERLFVCRAVVMGVESEPMRVMEKTKRRNRKTKHVKSKMRFTVLRVKEVKVRGLEELEGGEMLD